jgi:tryptophan-rich sensory protein
MPFALWSTMPDWLVILLLFELVIIFTNPNERDYIWFQGLRRPALTRRRRPR